MYRSQKEKKAIENIKTAERLIETAQKQRFLTRKEMALCRKLKINYQVVLGEFNGWGYERLGMKLKDSIEEIKPKIQKFIEEQNEIIKTEREKNKNKKRITITQKIKKLIQKYGEQGTVGLALYNLNKEAKKLRDKKREIIARVYDEEDEEDEFFDDDEEFFYRRRKRGTARQHEAIHKLNAKIEEIYQLKEKYLKLAIEKWGLTPLGYHRFNDGVARDYYIIGGFGFHANWQTSQNELGKIEGEIGAVKDAKRLSLDFAIKILEKILTKNPLDKGLWFAKMELDVEKLQ